MRASSLIIVPLFLAAAKLPGQTIPRAIPMTSPTSVAGTWSLPDSAAFGGLNVRLVETGSDPAKPYVRGTWSAPRIGCEPTESATCTAQGDIFGSRDGAIVSFELLPSIPGGLGGHAEMTLTAAAAMTGRVDVLSGGRTIALGWSTLSKIR